MQVSYAPDGRKAVVGTMKGKCRFYSIAAGALEYEAQLGGRRLLLCLLLCPFSPYVYLPVCLLLCEICPTFAFPRGRLNARLGRSNRAGFLRNSVGSACARCPQAMSESTLPCAHADAPPTHAPLSCGAPQPLRDYTPSLHARMFHLASSAHASPLLPLSCPSRPPDVKNKRGQHARGKKVTGLAFLPTEPGKLLITSNDSRIRWAGHSLFRFPFYHSFPSSFLCSFSEVFSETFLPQKRNNMFFLQ